MDSFAADLWRLPPPFNMVVLIVLIIFGYSLITEVAQQVRKYFSHRHELDLKRELVDRGLTIEEVERIVSAGGEQDEPKS